MEILRMMVITWSNNSPQTKLALFSFAVEVQITWEMALLADACRSDFLGLQQPRMVVLLEI